MISIIKTYLQDYRVVKEERCSMYPCVKTGKRCVDAVACGVPSCLASAPVPGESPEEKKARQEEQVRGVVGRVIETSWRMPRRGIFLFHGLSKVDLTVDSPEGQAILAQAEAAELDAFWDRFVAWWRSGFDEAESDRLHADVIAWFGQANPWHRRDGHRRR